MYHLLAGVLVLLTDGLRREETPGGHEGGGTLGGQSS